MYPLVKEFRHKAREVVYSYAKRNNIYIYNMYPNKKLKDVYPKYKILDYLRYSFYKFSIWIWLDDQVSLDIIDVGYLSKIIYEYNNKLPGGINKAVLISPLKSIGDYSYYTGDYDYLFMLHNPNNNFMYMYMYKLQSDCGSIYFLNKRRGYIKVIDDYNGYVYKLEL